ncbi:MULTISPECIES: acyl carrier protein [unclassified Carboxylicivirga]|uniref:acyl carrier protein n=1 Tax=Carboxylicivirga TaxID=1628153 RepID=UPI003D3421EC
MKDKIRDFIAEATYTDPGIIKDDTLIFEEGIFDSMALLNLITFLESEFGVVAEDTDLQEENFGSVQRIADYLERKRALVS